jgi:hypothetical protein
MQIIYLLVLYEWILYDSSQNGPKTIHNLDELVCLIENPGELHELSVLHQNEQEF